MVNARMIYEILDMEPVQREKPNAVPLKIENATVELRNVVFSYKDSGPILKGVSFVAEGGKTTPSSDPLAPGNPRSSTSCHGFTIRRAARS